MTNNAPNPRAAGMRGNLRTWATVLIGSTASLAPMLGADAAFAAPNPGQTVNNDYGQTPASANAEVAAQVNATPSVAAARKAVATAHATVLARSLVEATACRADQAAAESKVPSQIASTHPAYLAAHARTVAARAAETGASAALARQLASVTVAVRAQHYRPANGTWTGTAVQYKPPDILSTPVQVQIVVSGGHVRAIRVPQYVKTGPSGWVNQYTIPTLVTRALAAHDTARVANVTGASLTSRAFTKSLQSALTRAGFKG